jgi:hypothetical protein
MFGSLKTSTHKVKKTENKASSKNGNGRLSAKLLDYLERKYQLSPQDMLNLMAVYTGGHLGNLPAYFVRIYDKRTLNNLVKNYHDLDNYPNLIQYNGHILKDGFTYITECDTNAVLQSS